MVKIYTRFQTKTAQNPFPCGAAHTYIADIAGYAPGLDLYQLIQTVHIM